VSSPSVENVAELIAIARAAIAMFDPRRMELPLEALEGRRNVHVLALGKAAEAMAANASARLGRRVKSVTVAGPGQGSHPVPDERSVAAGEALLAAARAARSKHRVLALISGGGSALACVPAPGLSLADKRRATSELLARGASIDEINTARKHLSAIKGGQLAAASAAPVYSLILSDVVSGDLAAVASGPTLGDPTTIADARAVIERYDLDRSLGDRLVETPESVAGEHRCLGDNFDLTVTAIEMSGGRGVDAPLVGDVESVARSLVELGSGRWVGGGEPTMTLPERPGRGGRMTHLALLLARDLAGESFAAVCVGSDGVDGASGAAGAAVDGSTWSKIDGGDGALARADSATALAQAGALLSWGPTGTNLADLVLIDRG
jgi:hydroxypyruvate reductase